MPFFYGYDPTYYLFALPPLILALVAQLLVKSRFARYSRIANRNGITGREAAEEVLRRHGVYNVRVERVAGELTDHYDPRTQVIRLSESVYDSQSIAAVGVAAHEAGHAVQYAKGYAPIKIRMSILPFCNAGGALGPILFFVGLALSYSYDGLLGYRLALLGVALFAAVFVFQLVTLPVEFNASRRALETIRETNLLRDPEEREGARKVLGAAALTYVAAMLQTLMTLLYYVSKLRGRNDR